MRREPSERTLRIRVLNDEYRAGLGFPLGPHLGMPVRRHARRCPPGNDFIDRAVRAVRAYRDFAPDNDPYGEHDFGRFELDGETLFLKLSYYSTDLERGSPDPADPAANETRSDHPLRRGVLGVCLYPTFLPSVRSRRATARPRRFDAGERTFYLCEAHAEEVSPGDGLVSWHDPETGRICTEELAVYACSEECRECNS